MMREAFGIGLRHPRPIEWKTYYGMNIEWKAPGTQVSIRTAKGDLRICKVDGT